MVQLGLHLRLVGQGLLCKSKARLFSGQLRQIEAHKTAEQPCYTTMKLIQHIALQCATK